MKLLTWNVLHPDHAHKHEQKELDAKYLTWEWRKERIMSKLLRAVTDGVDVICLQEVDSSNLDDYKIEGFVMYHQNDKTRTKKLKQWIDLGRNLENKPNTLVCAILIKEGLQVSDVKIGSRSITMTIAGVKITNVHLEAGRNTTDIHIKHLSKMFDSDVVLGDFNDFPGEPATELLSEKGFLKIPDTITFKDGHRNWTIDYVFYNKKYKCKDIVWDDDFVGLTEKHSSDHMMIMVDFEIFK